MIDDALVGTWLLRSHHVDDSRSGERSTPFGRAPSGVLMLDAHGRMAVLITAGDTEAIGAAPLLAYSGHYRVERPDRLVTAVDVASAAPWVGTEQARRYSVTGNRLELGTVPQGDGSMATMTATMLWERETTAVASGGASD